MGELLWCNKKKSVDSPNGKCCDDDDDENKRYESYASNGLSNASSNAIFNNNNKRKNGCQTYDMNNKRAYVGNK